MRLDTSVIWDRELVDTVAIGVQPGIQRLLIVGAGEVVREKVLPAVQASQLFPAGIAVCSLEPESPLNGVEHLYWPVQDGSCLPLDELCREGFAGRDTLAYLATPPGVRLSYTLQLASTCRVALEKPVAADTAQAERLVALALDGRELYAADHKLFNTGARSAMALFGEHPEILDSVQRIEGEFYEMAGFAQGREQLDGIADIQVHLLAVVTAVFKPAAGRLPVSLERAWVATHEPDPVERYSPARVWTASRLVGWLGSGRRRVRYDLRQAKGASRNGKTIRLYDGYGNLLHEIRLDDSSVGAYARMLAELSKPQPDLRHTLDDARAVMQIVDIGRECAHQELPYAFGEMPAFLL